MVFPNIKLEISRELSKDEPLFGLIVDAAEKDSNLIATGFAKYLKALNTSVFQSRIPDQELRMVTAMECMWNHKVYSLI